MDGAERDVREADKYREMKYRGKKRKRERERERERERTSASTV